ILALCVRHGLLDQATVDHHGHAQHSDDDEAIERMLIRSVLNPQAFGLASNLRGLFGVAFHLRERLSLDNWRKLNQMVQQIELASEHQTMLDALVLLEESAASLVTLSGFALDGMTRDQGWRFLSIGRWIERVQFLCSNILDGMQLPPGCRLDWLLELADSIVTYRSRYMAAPEWMPLLDLLLLDDTNPRSVVFQLEGLIKYLHILESSHGACGAEILLPLANSLRKLQPEQDLRPDSTLLHSLLHDINTASNQIAQKIELRFFSNTEQHGTAAAKHEE
ncbi:MAG: alpha-E domain-containing protein, partial [Burkholderiales bacterium]|nr:alpha-E domain-containing protein [Burkholderiales bacterium]